MPEDDVKINAQFTKLYTVKYKIQVGQEDRGSLIGETTQYIFSGKEKFIIHCN